MNGGIWFKLKSILTQGVEVKPTVIHFSNSCGEGDQCHSRFPFASSLFSLKNFFQI
jgi:hypothetical protein